MNLKIEGDRKYWFLWLREIFFVNEFCFFFKVDLYIIKFGLMYISVEIIIKGFVVFYC